MEESDFEENNFEKKIGIEWKRNQILTEENCATTAEEEMESFIHWKKNFDKAQKVSKKRNTGAIVLLLAHA
jgi:hypothetical protein